MSGSIGLKRSHIPKGQINHNNQISTGPHRDRLNGTTKKLATLPIKPAHTHRQLNLSDPGCIRPLTTRTERGGLSSTPALATGVARPRSLE